MSLNEVVTTYTYTFVIRITIVTREHTMAGSPFLTPVAYLPEYQIDPFQAQKLPSTFEYESRR